MITATSKSSDIRMEVREANDKFENAFLKGDAAGIAMLYAEDGEVLAPGSQSIKGAPGIQNFWKGAMDMGVKKVKLDTIDVERFDDTVIESGHYSLSAEGDQQIENGKYIVIWKMRGNQWKIFKDIWNSNVSSQ